MPESAGTGGSSVFVQSDSNGSGSAHHDNAFRRSGSACKRCQRIVAEVERTSDAFCGKKTAEIFDFLFRAHTGGSKAAGSAVPYVNTAFSFQFLHQGAKIIAGCVEPYRIPISRTALCLRNQPIGFIADTESGLRTSSVNAKK